MKTIFKYELGTSNDMLTYLPKDANIICIQKQNGVPTAWVIVDDPDNLVFNNKDCEAILCVWTGYNHKGVNLEYYLETMQLDNGLVCHYFLV